MDCKDVRMDWSTGSEVGDGGGEVESVTGGDEDFAAIEAYESLGVAGVRVLVTTGVSSAHFLGFG